MKRFFALLLVVAAAAALGYWVNTRHNGNLHTAWSQVLRTATDLRGSTERTALVGSGQDPAAPAGEGQRRSRGQDPRVAVVTATAKSEDLPITRASVGWLEPVATVVVRARIEGEIIEQRVKDGEIVNEGDILFRLDDREIQAQIAKDEATLARDQATLAKTQADLRRVQELLPRGTATQQQFDLVTAESKVAAANVAAGQAALQADRIKLSYTTIKAPISGRVGVVRVTPGNLIRSNDTGEGLVTITQLKPLRASFSIPEKELGLLRAALARQEPAPVRAYVTGDEGPVATGKLVFVDSAVDTLSGTVTAKALFDNEDGKLWPGQYVRVEVDLGFRPNVTTVPLVAVQPGQGGSFAFVLKTDGTVERRSIEVADTRGNAAALASGVKPGEKVVVEGQQRLRDGSAVVEKAPTEKDKDQGDRTARVN